MRLRKPGSERPKRSGTAVASSVNRAVGGVVTTGAGVVSELLAIAREMLRIAARLYMRAAEAAGRAALAAWRFVLPALQVGWRLTRRALRVAERELTPVRAALAVAVGVGVILIASQFADYHSVSIGTEQYQGVSAVAPAPEIDAEEAGSAHAWIGIPLGLAAIGVAAACAAGRHRRAWLLAPIGVLTIAVSLIVDVPKGLDEGDTAVAYEGAEAMLQGGFWAQLACGVLLLALAPILTALLRPNGSPGVATPGRVRWGRLRVGEARS